MRKIFISLSVIILFSTMSIAQNRSLPSVDIKTLNGRTINTKSLENNGKPIVISFWFLQCKPCIKELNAIAEVYEEWQDETGVKLVAVSIDNARSKAKVAPFVNASEWDYEVYLDENGDLKRAMGVNTAPHTFLLNSKKEIIWQHKGYIDGDEDELFEQIKKLVH